LVVHGKTVCLSSRTASVDDDDDDSALSLLILILTATFVEKELFKNFLNSFYFVGWMGGLVHG
jgi:hypothetical protein